MARYENLKMALAMQAIVQAMIEDKRELELEDTTAGVSFLALPVPSSCYCQCQWARASLRLAPCHVTEVC